MSNSKPPTDEKSSPTVIQPRKVSQCPPPPPRIVGGSGDPGLSNKRARWSLWRHVPHVTLWEAISLSLNIEPETQDQSTREFKDRLLIATRALGTEDRSLSEFARWAMSIDGWKIPAELASLSAPSERAPAAKRQRAAESDDAELDDTTRRRDIVWPTIDKAIAQAGVASVEAVYLRLRELALKKEPPFTGDIDKHGALIYFDSKNRGAKLDRDALKRRLSRMKPDTTKRR